VRGKLRNRENTFAPWLYEKIATVTYISPLGELLQRVVNINKVSAGVEITGSYRGST
jgi:hypothetical protein